jgi:outer membrane protein TolC
LREHRARNKPGLAFDGDVHHGTPAAYTTGDARLQMIATDTLFDGGRVRASITNAEHLVRGAQAGFRVVEKDVELNVRLLFAEGLHAQRLVEIHRTSLERLRVYLALVEAQAAGGLGVAGDVLRTRAQVAAEEASIADAERTFDEQQVELNDLMGRPPLENLSLAPLPTPVPPVTPAGRPWMSVPDILEAEANTAAAQAAIAITRADRRPQLWVTGDVGRYQPLGTTGAGLNPGQGTGAELTLWFNWPFLDFGAYRARLAQAQLVARQTADSAAVVRRQSELEWSRAVEQIADFYRIYDLRARSVPLARDSYLLAESLYRGGVGTALDVIAAYSAWVDAQVAEADAIRDYRQAEARLIRWGSP